MVSMTSCRKTKLGLAFLAMLTLGTVLSLVAVGLPGARAQTPPLTDDEATLLALINDYRMENGLSPLGVSPTLTAAARWMSEDMATNGYGGQHLDSLGRTPRERMTAFGYVGSGWGEVIAWGQHTPEQTFEAWRNSPGHNEVMLQPYFAVAGVGNTANPWYWTVDFGDYDDSDGTWPTPTSTPTPTPSPSPSPTASPTPTPAPSPTAVPMPGHIVGCPVAGKWSVAVWSGADDTPTFEALSTCDSTAIEAAYWLDPDWQAWLRYFAEHPELSSLPTLDNFQGVLALGAQSTP